mmetsp:Transcript_12657/g.20564  ORF Transcript_12657/g.20564 Transcript_12657/m.20564 type:complete len:96 (-) Transcript_12657:52-339(-)
MVPFWNNEGVERQAGSNQRSSLSLRGRVKEAAHVVHGCISITIDSVYFKRPTVVEFKQPVGFLRHQYRRLNSHEVHNFTAQKTDRARQRCRNRQC